MTVTYLGWIGCAVCGDVSSDTMQCEACGIVGCDCVVSRRTFECGAPEQGLALCDECTPIHDGCSACDPDWGRG